ncbi:chaperonin-containing T-complex theta subunit Cct8 [Neoconidiobolus thromboides FSU 785]|nr:chaperonin-containing T-complex theta subunit Cct8 [Neoconidiobolus thromboides FSU 785]
MSLRVPKASSSSLFKDGYKISQGVDDAVIRNIDACRELNKITLSSFGPNGRNKIVVNHLEKLFVTNDAGTMINELEVVHPAAKILAQASQHQQAELGDASNLVLMLASELLDKAEGLLRMGLKPSEVAQGYEIASKKALELLETLCVENIENINESDLTLKVIEAAVGSKMNGYQGFLAKLVWDACSYIMPNKASNFNVDSVRIVKVMGSSLLESKVVKGMVFGREAEGNVHYAEKAKIAVFSCPIDISQTETKGTVLIHNAKEMLDFSKGEESQIEEAIKELAESGVKVIVSGGVIGDLALHFINRYGLMAVKCPSKFDLRRLSRVVGATPLARLGVPMAEEMGYCDIVESEEIGSDRVVIFRQETEKSKTSTILLRGATQNFLDDVERALDDGISSVKALGRDGRVLAGAGASETQLAKHLTSFGEKTAGLNQYAIKKFAEALEIVPRTLGETSGMSSYEILSKLHAAHYTNQENCFVGVDIDSEKAASIDAKEKGILDIYTVKHNAIELATHAALTVLMVDQIIMSKPAGGPKMPKNNPNWDED